MSWNLSREELKEKCEEKVEIVSPDSGSVVTTLEQMGIRKYTVVSANTVYAYGCTDRVNEITNQMVGNGVSIRQIGISGTSLEDFFLNTVGKRGARS